MQYKVVTVNIAYHTIEDKSTKKFTLQQFSLWIFWFTERSTQRSL